MAPCPVPPPHTPGRQCTCHIVRAHSRVSLTLAPTCQCRACLGPHPHPMGIWGILRGGVSPMCWSIRLDSYHPPPQLSFPLLKLCNLPLPLPHPMELSALLDIASPIRHPTPAGATDIPVGMRSASSTVGAGLWGCWYPHYLTEPQGLAPQIYLSRIKLELRITFFPLNKALSLGQLIIPLSSFP